MKIYIGNVGKLAYLEIAEEKGYGLCLVANAWRYPKPELHWFLDNGAYSAYRQGKQFPTKQFIAALEKIERCCSIPDFVVVPDIVAGGKKSLQFSRDWINSIPAGYPVYLAVQDGMNTEDIIRDLDLYDGLFVGGTLKWKLSTMSQSIKLSHSVGLKCHVGRIGTFRRLLMAKNAGADSIDSSTFVQADRSQRFGQMTGFKKLEAFEKQSTLGPRAVDLFGEDMEEYAELGI